MFPAKEHHAHNPRNERECGPLWGITGCLVRLDHRLSEIVKRDRIGMLNPGSHPHCLIQEEIHRNYLNESTVENAKVG